MYCTVLFVHQRAAAKRCSLQEHTAGPTCYISQLRVLYCLGTLYLCCSLWFLCPKLRAECFASIFMRSAKNFCMGFMFKIHSTKNVKGETTIFFHRSSFFPRLRMVCYNYMETLHWILCKVFHHGLSSLMFTSAIHRFKSLFNIQRILKSGSEIIHTTICNVLKES